MTLKYLMSSRGFPRAKRKSALSLSLCVAAAVLLAAGCSSKGGTRPEATDMAVSALVEAKANADVLGALQAHERTRVIVSLRENKPFDRMAVAGNSVHITRAWKHVAGFAADLDRAGLEILAADPNVKHVRLDDVREAQLAESLPLVRADRVHRSGHTGKGQTVVVIDSGVVADHPMLSGKIVGEACFCRGIPPEEGPPSGSCCPDGSREQMGPGASKDDRGHGSHVAGIVAGVAPEAKLVSVKVLNSNGLGVDSDILSALDWVAENHPDAAVVNMSLGGGVGSASDCGESIPEYRQAFSVLRAKGVLVAAAAGNGARSTGITEPGCADPALSVGAVHDADIGRITFSRCTDESTSPDQIACLSNSAPNLDFLAPGSLITSVNYKGGTRAMSGTSMATPHVAGAIAVMRAANPNLTPDEIEHILKYSGVPITDKRNNVAAPRINVEAAVHEAVRRSPAQ